MKKVLYMVVGMMISGMLGASVPRGLTFMQEQLPKADDMITLGVLGGCGLMAYGLTYKILNDTGICGLWCLWVSTRYTLGNDESRAREARRYMFAGALLTGSSMAMWKFKR